VSWDLALADNGDLIISGSRDLAGKSGTDLLEQRMTLRLKLHRGEWTYDDNDSLGSQLYRLIGENQTRAASLAPAYVREALREMEDEVSIDDVQVNFYDSRSITLTLIYTVLDDLGGQAEQNAQELEITIPFGGTI
jgi:phage gp46-like protein